MTRTASIGEDSLYRPVEIREMPVVFKCDCGKYLSVRSKNVGKKVECPECGSVNVVPDPQQRRSKRVKRLKTQDMPRRKLGRLRAAAEEDREEVVRDEELVELDLPREEPSPPPPKSDRKRRKKRASEKIESPVAPGDGSIEMTCFCGKTHIAGPEKAGEDFLCDDCGRVITIPGGAKADLDLMPLEEGEPCPKCGTLLEEETKICRSCGHRLDLRLRTPSQRVATSSEEEANPKSKSKRKKR